MDKELTSNLPMSVLIVDDNRDNVELMCQMLEEECSIITAYSGAECIEKALSERPDLILLDINMPEMDGYQTMQTLQQDDRTKDILVIFVSAYYKQSSMIVKGLEQGAFDYLTKPVDENILLAKLHVAKRIIKAESELRGEKVKLQITNKRLELADQLKSVFLASMSHELRTPLNSIIGFTGLMLMQVAGTINDAQKEQLSRVKRNANHLLELINDVLDISKIEAGKAELTIAEFNITELLNEVVQTVAIDVKNKGLKFVLDLPDHAVIIINDSRRIRQIITNFMSNAIKFTEHGSITVSLTVDGPQRVNIAVEDTGIGIKQDDERIMFEPFQQLNADLTKNYQGTGLGLYLCEKLTNMIGGNIQVKSKFGKGSQFNLILPVAFEESDLDNEKNISH